MYGTVLPSRPRPLIHRSVLVFHVEEEDSSDEVDVDDVDSLVLLVPVILLAVSFLGPGDEELRRLPLDEIIMDDGRSKVMLMRSCVAVAAGAPPRFIMIKTLLEMNGR